jgi:hypothetical protein
MCSVALGGAIVAVMLWVRSFGGDDSLPLRRRVYSDHGSYLRPTCIADGDGRWLTYDIDRNILFLAIKDKQLGNIVIAGSRDSLILGVRQGISHKFTSFDDTFFLGLPDGEVRRMKAPPGFTDHIVGSFLKAPSMLDDVRLLVVEGCKTCPQRECQAILAEVMKTQQE